MVENERLPGRPPNAAKCVYWGTARAKQATNGRGR